MISILHPTRSRPEKSWKTCNNWIKNAHTDVELIISIDIDDPHREEYLNTHRYLGTIVTSLNRSAVDAVNRAAEVAKGDILIVVSDDTECTYGWGKHIEKMMHGKCDWILKTQDGIQLWIITMPLMDRTYYERFGYIYHPDYKHMYADTDLTCVAELTGCKIVTTFQFPHNHISANGQMADNVTLKANATFESGRKVFKDRLSRMFDLPQDQIIGQLTQNHYTNEAMCNL
jgi:hypothetical protein